MFLYINIVVVQPISTCFLLKSEEVVLHNINKCIIRDFVGVVDKKKVKMEPLKLFVYVRYK